jgi:hypothetical protein
VNKISLVLTLTAVSVLISPFRAQAEMVNGSGQQQKPVPMEMVNGNWQEPPEPGTIATSIAAFPPSLQKNTSEKFTNSNIAQRDITRDNLNPDKYSYVGVSGNIGLQSDCSCLGDTAFAINSKVALKSNLSLRPAVIFGDETGFLIPVTYDFTMRGADPFEKGPFTPYLGGGAVITTAETNNLGFLATGGMDYRFSSKFVANAALNIGFVGDSTDVGLLLGVGYILPKF